MITLLLKRSASMDQANPRTILRRAEVESSLISQGGRATSLQETEDVRSSVAHGRRLMSANWRTPRGGGPTAPYVARDKPHTRMGARQGLPDRSRARMVLLFSADMDLTGSLGTDRPHRDNRNGLLSWANGQSSANHKAC
jgi:hypothetical protein